MAATAESGQATPAFRLTPQRAAVLHVVRHARDHPTARDIYERVRRGQPGIGFATVYRALNLLVQHAEIREVQLGDDGVTRYDGNTAQHHHVVCHDCGTVADLGGRLPASLSEDAAHASGFAVDGYQLCFTGRCPACRADGG